MSTELKPCPFCGEAAVSLRLDGDDGWCVRHRPVTPECILEACMLGGWHESPEVAADSWNRRADPWRKFGEGTWPEFDTDVLMYDAQHGRKAVINFDHDSDPEYWLDHGFTHWILLPEDPQQ